MTRPVRSFMSTISSPVSSATCSREGSSNQTVNVCPFSSYQTFNRSISARLPFFFARAFELSGGLLDAPYLLCSAVRSRDGKDITQVVQERVFVRALRSARVLPLHDEGGDIHEWRECSQSYNGAPWPSSTSTKS